MERGHGKYSGHPFFVLLSSSFLKLEGGFGEEKVKQKLQLLSHQGDVLGGDGERAETATEKFCANSLAFCSCI